MSNVHAVKSKRGNNVCSRPRAVGKLNTPRHQQRSMSRPSPKVTITTTIHTEPWGATQ